jgi:hypothetical protein
MWDFMAVRSVGQAECGYYRFPFISWHSESRVNRHTDKLVGILNRPPRRLHHDALYGSGMMERYAHVRCRIDATPPSSLLKNRTLLTPHVSSLMSLIEWMVSVTLFCPILLFLCLCIFLCIHRDLPPDPQLAYLSRRFKHPRLHSNIRYTLSGNYLCTWSHVYIYIYK